MLRFGIIGMGSMGRTRAREILARRDAELVAVCDAEEKALDAVDVPHRLRSAADLIALDIDAVLISAYNDVAASYTIDALKAGKHVLCEKPPARSTAELEEVAKIERGSDLVLKYGFNHRYHYSVIEAKKLINRGSFGKLLWMKGTYGKAGGEGYRDAWRNKRDVCGGGILIDQGIHMLDLMLLFAGDIERATGTVQSTYWKTDVEDNVFALMEGSGGVAMTLHSSATLWRHKFLLEICFEEGLIVLDGILSSTRSYADETLVVVRRQFEGASFAHGKPQEERIYFDQDNSCKLELEEFVQAVRGHAPLVNGTISDALRLMRTIEAIYESSGFYDEVRRRNSCPPG